MFRRSCGAALVCLSALAFPLSVGAAEPKKALTAVKDAPRKAAKGSRRRLPPHVVTPERMNFWSFRPVTRPALPEVQDAGWVARPIDSFVLRKLEEARLEPAPPADKISLLRRVYFDLTGLPPKPAEVDAFLDDDSPDAYEKVLERLLKSPRYGERWARHWLDVVRYAESNSFERDSTKPNVWRYRDYVIDAFNNDKPFDRFVREQLAGDELEDVTIETIIATGYYRLGPWDDEPTDKLQAKYDELDDIVATTSQAFLGLTMNCARCHDHKLDPLPQKDYYGMLAFFHGMLPFQYGDENVQTVIAPELEREAYEKAWRTKERKVEAATEKLRAFEAARVAMLPPEKRAGAQSPRQIGDILRANKDALLDEEAAQRWEELKKTRKEAQQLEIPTVDMALSVKESGGAAPETFVLVRGNAHTRGDPVEPTFPAILGAPAPRLPERPSDAKSSGRRLALANWITSPDNQLTARVMANRIWQHHFGRGIVMSPNNFGKLGVPPSHPELLDWLASEFVESGWSVKHMHRLIMTSSAYRMSSRANTKGLAEDPENRLLWRMSMRRLGAEEIRDAILAVNGTLNLEAGGPSVYPEIQKDILQTQSKPGHNWNTSPLEEQRRRSIYVHVKRSLVLPILAAFDFADTDTSCPVRFATTQPTQALTLLNSPFLNRSAADFAARLRQEAGEDPGVQVRHAFRLALSRQASTEEIDRGVALIESLREEGLSQEQALEQFCLMVFNMNEFFYLD